MFLLITVLLSLVGWVVTFGAACAVGTALADGYPTTWWIVIFELLLILGVCFVIITDTMLHYRHVILTFLAVSIVYLTSNLSAFVPSSAGAARALSAGMIIMIIMQFLWVFVFGSHEDSYIATAANGNGRNGGMHSGNGLGLGAGNGNVLNNGTGNGNGHGMGFGAAAAAAPAFFAGNRAEKEELESKNAGQSMPLGNVGYPEMNGQNGGVYQANHPAQTLAPAGAGAGAGAAAAGVGSAPSGGVSGSASPLQYNEQVTALHAYQANPDDATELSFAKGENLEVVERKGNWWQARKEDGTIGIVPSNYFAN
ncbi:hypothetical protein INT43_000332 [Umbelopsis isabellina]|uniref:SH3 domain-containing protein n=1 Tax=Mortierella isabellina TaxID=91625 RepID=A0A8H7Q333_MORIS|nr:hypothetical protein INT43_000332 [Umbelopsis isabellina]